LLRYLDAHGEIKFNRREEKSVKKAIFRIFLYTFTANFMRLKMKRILFCLVATLALAACSNRQSQSVSTDIDSVPSLIMQIQKCSKLYTTDYHIHKIVTHDDQMKLNGTALGRDFSVNLPLGKRKIAIPMDATLKAYIDFSEFSEENIRRNGDQIEVILPDPHITLTSSRINHSDIKQQVSILRSNFSDEELTKYERQGRKAILNDVPKMGIVERARESAAHTLIPLFASLGYDEQHVTISFRKDFSAKEIATLIDKSTIENVKTKEKK